MAYFPDSARKSAQKAAGLGRRLTLSGSKLFLFLLCTVLLVGGAAYGVYGYPSILIAAWFSGGVGFLWVVADGLWERRNEELDRRADLVTARTRFAATIAGADKEVRFFLAHEWPELGQEFGEEHMVYVLENGENTEVLVNFLQVFLRDSSEIDFVDVRNYNDDKYLQERFEVPREVVRTQWHKATQFLARKGYLKPESMAGNRTWQWTTQDHCRRLRRRYLHLNSVPELT